ncbi:MAG: hypothetical protein KBF83_02290 [Pyrinomonadaceae bacterium]|nr:hypothetical protein [Pyrinomonadaceae bacterium]MBP9108363.1 hypothetical protein [Pyrinomonadaceae bacterium]
MKGTAIKGRVSGQFIAVLFIAITIIGVVNAVAGTKEWDGFADGFDGNWTTNNNWKGIGGAGPNDDLIFADKVCNLITGCFWTLKNTTTTNNFPINTSFKSLTLSGTRYRIRGNQIFLQNGLTFGKGQVGGNEPTPETTWNPNIILGDSQLWDGGLGDLIVNGIINLNGHVLEVAPLDKLILNGDIGGSGLIEKDKSGLLTINGNAANFGRTTVKRGVLEVNGSLGRVEIESGTLQGVGFVKDVFSRFATDSIISPGSGGNTSAILRASGEVELSRNTTLEIDLNGPGAGTDYDQLRVTGADISLAGTDLDVRLGFTPATGQQFVIVSQVAAGGVIGTFEQEGAFVEDGLLFQISYNANSVVLTCLGPAIP